ncbi:MAG: hypothetical protein IPI10_08780 [Bacteroidetes bacterium]|nr:hypothetical protein [Bacteroidota bacterium]
MDVKLFSSNFKIATFLILAHFSFLMSFGQNKPKSNLVKIGNCTYSVDGNISAFNEAVLLQKKGDLNEAILCINAVLTTFLSATTRHTIIMASVHRY